MARLRTYSDVSAYSTFEERFRYLSLGGSVGADTFGFDRYINQQFYMSAQWKHIREYVIVRDNGCDLGIPGYEIHHRLLVHHMNPLVASALIHGSEDVLDPEFLITTTHRTHNAIHYGVATILNHELKPRTRGDTKLW